MGLSSWMPCANAPLTGSPPAFLSHAARASLSALMVADQFREARFSSTAPHTIAVDTARWQRRFDCGAITEGVDGRLPPLRSHRLALVIITHHLSVSITPTCELKLPNTAIT